MRRIVFFTVFLLISALPATHTFCQINAAYTDTPIQFDGLPDEESWNAADVLSDFTQQEPDEGAAPTERTEVRFLQDKDNLYIGIICYDSNPGGIIHKVMKQDQDPGGDDRISFLFSTYNDSRTGYLFSTNPNGFRYDASAPGPSGSVSNPDWNGIWDARAKITGYGWTAEIVIPFKTLRFPATPSQTWGLNIVRTIRRKNEVLLWRAWSRDDGIWRMSKMGTLTIGQPVERGHHLDITPYVLGGAEKRRNEDVDDEFKYGVDVKYGISSNTQIQLTTKTDFAQIESDREVINLTRFDIRYPEQRDFFLENAELFDFDQGATRLFYSRRIGISANRASIPILGGAKLSHTSGSFRLGVMSMQTEEESGMPSTNYSVIRMHKDIWEQSSLGFITTSLADEDGHDSQTFAGDFIFKTDSFMGDRNFEIQSYFTGTLTDGKGDNSIAGRVYAHYPSDLIDAFVLYHAFGRGFNPEMGFLPRDPGMQQYMASFKYTPRPGLPFIRKLAFQPLYYSYITDTTRRLLSRYFNIQPFGFITDDGDEMGFALEHTYEFIDEPFNIHDDIIIPVGTYDWLKYTASLTTSGHRPVVVELDAETGDFFNGSRSKADIACTYRQSRFYSLTADVIYNRVEVSNRSFITREYGGRVTMDFTTYLSTSLFGQWNNETNEMNFNFRIHYAPKVGSNFYLVYNHILDEKYDYRTIRNTGLLKLDYTYRF